MDKETIYTNLLQEMKRGTLVFSVLLSLKEESYGYSLVSSLKSLGLEVEQNTLYPLLRRLEKQGLLESLWNTEDSRPRKYYKTSEMGLEIGKMLSDNWRETNLIMEKLIGGEV